jgi:hypothetical protein
MKTIFNKLKVEKDKSYLMGCFENARSKIKELLWQKRRRLCHLEIEQGQQV